MLGSTSLWQDSPPWRCVVVLTITATMLSVLLFLRSTGTPVVGASYTPPVPQTPQRPTTSAIASTQAALPAGAQAPPATLPNPAGSTESHDPDFDVAVASGSASQFPPGTELHAVGVYKGAPPRGQTEKPWWANCTGQMGDSRAMQECHAKYAGQHATQSVTVHVSAGRPMVLALMSYEPVLWKIEGASSNLQQVVLAGYESQQIAGVPASVPVIVQTSKASSCPGCVRKAGYFYSYDEGKPEHGPAISKLEVLTGLQLTSFQGAYQENAFSVSGGNGGSVVADSVQSYVDGSFRDELKLAGVPVMLPEGQWRGLFYQRNNSAVGEDQILVLAQLDGARLRALLAVRARTNQQRQGFPVHRACNLIQGYVVKSEANESFGPQLCQWVTHVTMPWSQPAFAAAADKLTALNVDVPDVTIASGMHRADMARSVSVVYYGNPQFQGIRTPHATWSQSAWHPSRLDASPEKLAYVDEQMKQATIWYQLLRAQRLH